MTRNALVGRDLGSIVGVAAGALAWVFGYTSTYLLVGDDVRDSSLHRIIEFFTEEPATYEMVGWVFYNAHFVMTVFQNVPFFGSESYVGGEDGFTQALYLLPPALLLVAGVAVARYRSVTDVGAGVVAGLLVVPGYFLLSVAGVVLFEVSVGDASGAPDVLPAVVLAGVMFPMVFASIGGVLAAVTASRW